jgi:hypothetical protein
MSKHDEQDYLKWYNRINSPGTPFDPTELVALALAQWPGEPLMAEAFAHCRLEWPESELYTHFLSKKERDTRWNYCGGDWLEHPTLGTLLVDFIHDPTVPGGRAIGGMEYMSRVMDPAYHRH